MLIRLFLSCVLVLFSLPARSEVTRFLAGNPADVKPPLHGPAYHLQGGGDDVDAAFQWMFDQVRGCNDCDTKLDVVVLRASGDDEYDDYLLAMKGVDSVETLIITAPEDYRQPGLVEIVQNAEIIFFGGGDQCDYVKNIKGTPLQTAVEFVNARGGGISGTSAGQAIQGDFSYDACTGSTRSFEALANPYHESISFTYNFFHWANMQKTITEQHLVERDRMGRALAFLARQIRDGKTKSALSMAVDRETSLGIDKNGLATVMGKGPAYFILADHRPEVCEPNKPLTYSNFKLWKVDAGGAFDLKNRPRNGYYLRSVKNGVIDSDPYAEFPCVLSEEVKAAPAKKQITPGASADSVPAQKLLELASHSKDPVQVRQSLETVIRLCPRDFEPYSYLEATNNPKFIKAKVTELRRFLNYTIAPDRLVYFSTLWALEFKTYPADQLKDLRKQIAEDLEWLSEVKDFRDLQALRVLRQGYDYVSDQAAVQRIDEEIRKRFPESPQTPGNKH